ncbi:putative polygalacturonase [Rosa chinensis]|uniref:Putative polygalacturonase n=1 Tax=Rosa chinensis TaxID=74649 RepID=A0A2P6SN89_ROSCH|nr:putative polygalacturonase [Rosa chinensis]
MRAVDKLSQYASNGGAQLIVPPGKWLTGSFNLTSYFTLFLHNDGVILGSQGRGRDAPGGRRINLVFGSNLTDVVTMAPLMDKVFLGGTTIYILYLFACRCGLHSRIICSNITIQSLTILAPFNVLNTDGINPDSCSQTRIEDCYIVSGDDCIAVKSGWDQDGINFACQPTNRASSY